MHYRLFKLQASSLVVVSIRVQIQLLLITASLQKRKKLNAAQRACSPQPRQPTWIPTLLHS